MRISDATDFDSLDTDAVAEPVAFGLIVIGDEVLNGARVDGHLAAF